MKERWKDIEGFEEQYQISSLGRVKSLERYVKNNLCGEVLQEGRMMSIQSFSDGYQYVTLWKDGKRRSHSMHRLIAAAYIPNPENKPEVNHKDGIKTNNYETNLEWVTSSENKIHAHKTGLTNNSKGMEHRNAKFTDDQIRWIRRLRGKVTNSLLAKIYGVDKSTISNILTYKTWRHIK